MAKHRNVEFEMLPAELLRSTPRDVKLTGAGWAVTIIAVVLAAGAILFPVWSVITVRDASGLKDRMSREGRISSGVILDVGRTGGDRPRRIVRYGFEANGTRYEDHTELDWNRTRQFTPGMTIPIRYLPSDPNENWIEGFPPSGIPVLVIPLATLGLLASPVAMLAQIRKQRELLTEGRATLARVTAVSKVRKGQHSAQRVEFEFPLLTGSVAQGKADFAKNPPAPGANIVLLYDRENPSRNVRYPLRLVRVEVPLD